MPGRLPRLPGVVASVDTAGEGYFFGATVHGTRQVVGTIVGTIDNCRAWQFVLPFRATINRIQTEVTTGGGAGKKYGAGLYDSAKNLVVETGALDANTTQVNITTVTEFTVEPGVYWVAGTSDSTTTQLRRFDFETTALNVATTPRAGIAANGGSAGVMPSTLGNISSAQSPPPIVLFYKE